jgi:hypothetical protein
VYIQVRALFSVLSGCELDGGNGQGSEGVYVLESREREREDTMSDQHLQYWEWP